MKLECDPACDVHRFWVTKIANKSLLSVWHRHFRLDEGAEQNSTENLDFTDSRGILIYTIICRRYKNHQKSNAFVTL